MRISMVDTEPTFPRVLSEVPHKALRGLKDRLNHEKIHLQT